MICIYNIKSRLVWWWREVFSFLRSRVRCFFYFYFYLLKKNRFENLSHIGDGKKSNPIFKVCLVLVFKNCYLFLKTKNKKNLFGEGGMFLFFVFSVFSKITFLRTIKRCFNCFFTIQRIDCFLCFHKGELHPTTTPPPANPFFFFKLLKLISSN